jgi:hypothetical protein
VEEVLPTLVENNLMTYVQLVLATCLSTTCTFDLWMFVRAHDLFVVNFLSNNNLEFKHATIGLFKDIETSRATMVVKLWMFLSKFSFMEKKSLIAYVKDEGPNSQCCVIAFNLMVSCKSLSMLSRAFSWFLLWACSIQGLLVHHYRKKKLVKD